MRKISYQSGIHKEPKYFRHWSRKPSDDEFSLLEQALKNVVGEVRINRGRNEKTTFVIVDAQSVKNTDTAEQKGYDAGKKVSGLNHYALKCIGCPLD